MKYFLLLTTLLAFIILPGCSGGNERNHPLFRKGESHLASGNGQEAAECFKELLKRRPESVYAHLKLASVYDELLNEPLMAILHYKLYLEAMPDAVDAQEVEAWIRQAEKRYLQTVQVPAETTPATSEVSVPADSNVELLIACLLPSATTPQVKKFTTLLEAELQKLPGILFITTQITPEGKYSSLLAFNSDSNCDELTEKIKNLLNSIAPEYPEGITQESFSVSMPEKVTANLVYEQKIKSLENKLAQYHARYQFMSRELERLRKIEAEYKKRAGTGTAASAPAPALTQTQQPAAPHSGGVKTYTVVAGDTPGKIALKIYGKSSLYTHILRANPQVNERKLRPGMVLTIPELPSGQ